MGPSLGRSEPNSKRFLEDRRDLLLWLAALTGGGSTGPSYLVDEHRDYIIFGEDRIIVREARS